MDIDEKKESNNYNNHLIKSLYCLKKNFPSSQLFFIIFYSLKYIGLIANSRIVEMSLIKKLFHLTNIYAIS